METDPETRGETLRRYFDLYTDYARMLRLWLVAYGVGAPVLFLTRPDVADKIIESEKGAMIAIAFLLGVAFQVINAAANKWAAWYMYTGLSDEQLRKKRRYRVSKWISNQFWIDLFLDLGAMALFAWATVATLLVVLG